MAPHGFTVDFDTMGVVDEAVQDGIGVDRISDQLMPSRHGELTGDKGRAPATSVFEYFEQVVPGIAVKRFEAPVVEDEKFDARQALHARGDPAIALGKCQFLDQPWQPCVEDRAVVAARLVAERTTTQQSVSVGDGIVLRQASRRRTGSSRDSILACATTCSMRRCSSRSARRG